MRKIYILRGIPGTGKTTWAYKKLELLMHKRPYEHIFLISRDGYRMREVNYSESEYQKSFKDEQWNNSIKKRFWEYAYNCFEKADVVILDTTMIGDVDLADINAIMLKWILIHRTQPEIRWKIFTKQYFSTHNVPEEVMQKYKEMYEITKKRPLDLWDYWNDDEKKSYKTKVEYI